MSDSSSPSVKAIAPSSGQTDWGDSASSTSSMKSWEKTATRIVGTASATPAITAASIPTRDPSSIRQSDRPKVERRPPGSNSPVGSKVRTMPE